MTINYCHSNISYYVFTDTGSIPWEILSKILHEDDRDELELECSKRGDRLSNILWPECSHPVKKTIIHSAIEYQAYNCFLFLLGKCASNNHLNQPDSEGKSPLHYAVEIYQNESLLLPCMRKLRLSVYPEAHNEPIYFSYAPQIIKVLLGCGAFVNQRNSQGDSPLHCLTKQCIDKTPLLTHSLLQGLEALLSDETIHVDANNNEQSSPLEAIYGEISIQPDSVSEFCRKLIQNGSRASNYYIFKLQFHGTRKINENKDKKKKIKKDEFSELLHYIIAKEEPKIKSFFKINARKHIDHWQEQFIGEKYLIFHLISEFSHEIVQCFLTFGGDPWKPYNDNKLALSAALQKGDFRMVDLLLEHMKNRDEQDTLDLKGRTASLFEDILRNLNIDKQMGINFHSCLERLLQKDIILEDYRHPEFSESCPIEHAIEAGDLTALKLILKYGQLQYTCSKYSNSILSIARFSLLVYFYIGYPIILLRLYLKLIRHL